MNLPTKLEITEAGLCKIRIYCIYVKRQINFERLCLGCYSKSMLLNTPYFWTPINSVYICLAWSCFGSNRFTSFKDIWPFLLLLFIRSTTSYIGLIFYNWSLACTFLILFLCSVLVNIYIMLCARRVSGIA
jgi:hypothetical protein